MTAEHLKELEGLLLKGAKATAGAPRCGPPTASPKRLPGLMTILWDRSNIGSAGLAGDLSGPPIRERDPVPTDLADEPQDDSSVEVVVVGNRLGILPLDIGEQPGLMGTGMATTRGAEERGGVRCSEVPPRADHPTKEGGGA